MYFKVKRDLSIVIYLLLQVVMPERVATEMDELLDELMDPYVPEQERIRNPLVKLYKVG